MDVKTIVNSIKLARASIKQAEVAVSLTKDIEKLNYRLAKSKIAQQKPLPRPQLQMPQMSPPPEMSRMAPPTPTRPQQSTTQGVSEQTRKQLSDKFTNRLDALERFIQTSLPQIVLEHQQEISNFMKALRIEILTLKGLLRSMSPGTPQPQQTSQTQQG